MFTGGSAARADFRGGVGWVVLGLVVLVAAWRMDRFEAMGGTAYTAPGLVPGLFGLSLAVLGTVLAWRSRRRLRAERAAAGVVAGPGPLLNRRVWGTLALTLGYALGLVGHAPFGVSTAVFVAAFTAIYADAATPWPRRLALAVLAGALTAIAIVLVFEDLFLVRLP
ncbi:MAG: tripartite tricarboxylate transporter TctB family protein [Rubrivivax sp.]